MVIYLLVTQIMLTIKQANNTKDELAVLIDEDPYWKAVLDENMASTKDFLAHDSFALNSMVLLLNNLSTLIFASEMIFPIILSKYWTVLLVMLIVNVLTIGFLSVMIYKGTTFKKMFSRTN